jgi:DNA-binding CsgD family transcriptional regulator
MREQTSDFLETSELWRELLAGTWIVIDHFATAGARTLVCRPGLRGSCHQGLTAEEARVAGGRARGASLKMLAGELRRALPNVSAALGRAMRKLKLSSEAELVALFGDRTPRAIETATVRFGLDECLVVTYAPPAWQLPSCLSPVERIVVLDLIAGASQLAIARARGTSPRTVANQVASAFRKLGVHSRVELFVALER